MLSTYHDESTKEIEKRGVKKNKPLVIIDYNNSADQMVTTYPAERGTRSGTRSSSDTW